MSTYCGTVFLKPLDISSRRKKIPTIWETRFGMRFYPVDASLRGRLVGIPRGPGHHAGAPHEERGDEDGPLEGRPEAQRQPWGERGEEGAPAGSVRTPQAI